MQMREEWLRESLQALEAEGLPMLRYADRRALDEGRHDEVLALLRGRMRQAAWLQGSCTVLLATSSVFLFLAPPEVFARWVSVLAACLDLAAAIGSAALLGSSLTRFRVVVEELERLADE